MVQATCEVTRCIFYDNGEYAIDSRTGQTTVSCTDQWDYEQGTQMLGVIDGGGNFIADPGFCYLGGEDPYLLRSDSPCLPGNHPNGIDCGLIGRYGLGCEAPTPIEETTWGQINWRMLDDAAKGKPREDSSALP